VNILELAVASGMQVTLDARIGTLDYTSVHGSLQTLRRFAEAVLVAASVNSMSQELIEAEGRNGTIDVPV
jgi:hypothetical protein